MGIEDGTVSRFVTSRYIGTNGCRGWTDPVTNAVALMRLPARALSTMPFFFSFTYTGPTSTAQAL